MRNVNHHQYRVSHQLNFDCIRCCSGAGLSHGDLACRPLASPPNSFKPFLFGLKWPFLLGGRGRVHVKGKRVIEATESKFPDLTSTATHRTCSLHFARLQRCTFLSYVALGAWEGKRDVLPLLPTTPPLPESKTKLHSICAANA